MSKSSKQPISEARLAANRANAAKSTGPRTPEGKARSSQNAVKHGFRAASFAVIRLEDIDEVANLKADAVAFYNPENAQELIAVERIAMAQQMIFRAGRLEAGLFTTAMNESLDRYNYPVQPMDEAMVGCHDLDICKSQNRNYCLGVGFRRMAQESNIWSVMLRFRAQADREYRRALEDFERLKALRAEIPNEPANLIQPEQPAELIPANELNFRIPKRALADPPPPASTPKPVPAPENPPQATPLKPAA